MGTDSVRPGKPTQTKPRGERSLSVQVYFLKNPAAVATPFVARLLRLGGESISKKCSFRRGAFTRGGGTITPPRTREIVPTLREKSALATSSRRATPRNRANSVALPNKAARARAEVQNPSDKSASFKASWAQNSLARLPPQWHDMRCSCAATAPLLPPRPRLRW